VPSLPRDVASRVMGSVLTHATPTDPVKTTSGAAIYTAIEKPVLMPLMYLTMFLSPLVWAMNWLSYRNGSAQLSTMRSSFASPAVIARGMLGMMCYDALEVLPQIHVPTLVVVGDRDSVTKPEAGRRISVAIPGARLVTLSPAKHLGLIERHTDYAVAVREFAYAAAAKAKATSGGVPIVQQV
jgi:pimeloyl-ACP methyl ester carboxylesterase